MLTQDRPQQQSVPVLQGEPASPHAESKSPEASPISHFSSGVRRPELCTNNIQCGWMRATVRSRMVESPAFTTMAYATSTMSKPDATTRA